MLTFKQNLPTVTIIDLKQGDLLIWPVLGAPHCAIYSPQPGKQGDLIHMVTGLKRRGVVKSTLSQQLRGLDKTSQLIVVRSRKPGEGRAFAEQAEFWLRQGIMFDDVRLSKSLYNYAYPGTFPSTTVNILKYCLLAARRETAPIKPMIDATDEMGLLTFLGIMLLAPKFHFARPLAWLGKKMVEFSKHGERQKGMSCAGFVLSCIAAVKLKNVISPVTVETGWVSLKYSQEFTNTSLKFHEALQFVKEEINAPNFDGPSLQNVLSAQQMKHFDLKQLENILTSAIANTNPNLPSADAFMKNLLNDSDNWQVLGTVDKNILRTDFNKKAYKSEGREIEREIEKNRAAFQLKFGAEISQRRHNRHTFFGSEDKEKRPRIEVPTVSSHPSSI